MNIAATLDEQTVEVTGSGFAYVAPPPGHDECPHCQCSRITDWSDGYLDNTVQIEVVMDKVLGIPRSFHHSAEVQPDGTISRVVPVIAEKNLFVGDDGVQIENPIGFTVTVKSHGEERVLATVSVP